MFYPIVKFFLYDRVDTAVISLKYGDNPVASLKRLSASSYNEKELKREIASIVCETAANSPYNVLEALFDYFPDVLFSNIKFNRDDFKSVHIRKSGLIDFKTAMNIRLNLDDLAHSLIDAKKVADIDELFFCKADLKELHVCYRFLIMESEV